MEPLGSRCSILAALRRNLSGGGRKGIRSGFVLKEIIFQAAERRGGLPRARALLEPRGDKGERRRGRVARGRVRKKM